MLIMTNLQFFKTCWQNELNATINIFAALPNDKLNYRPHEINRSAYEIVEHLIQFPFQTESEIQEDVFGYFRNETWESNKKYADIKDQI